MNHEDRPSERMEIRLMPEEEVQLSLDPRHGISYELSPGSDALILTSQRVMQVGRAHDRKAIAAAPLEHVGAVEIRYVERPIMRLCWGLLATIIGVALSIIIWATLEAPLLAMLLGGIIAVVGIWLILAYTLNAEESHLCFHTSGHRICLPLYTHQSAQGAHQLYNRFFELVQSRRTMTEPPVLGVVATPPPMETTSSATSPSSDPGPIKEQVDERTALLEKLESERKPLLELIQHMDDDVAGRHPRESEWSVKQVLAHLVEVEREFVQETVQGAKGDSPEVGFTGEHQWAEPPEDVNQRPLHTIQEEMALIRDETVKVIQGISNQTMATFHVRHRRMGEVTLLHLLKVIYRHDRVHTQQIEQTFRTLSPNM